MEAAGVATHDRDLRSFHGMGQSIFYCTKCAVRLLSSDIEKGNAFLIGHQALCRKCAPPDAGRDAEGLLLSGKTPHRGTPLPAATPRGPLSPPLSSPRSLDSGPSSKTRRAITAAARNRPRRITLILGLAGVLLCTLMLIGILSSSSPSAPPGPPPPSAHPPPHKAEEAATRAAQLAWEKAYTFMKEHPGDLAGQIAAYEEAIRAAQGTPYFERAREALEALRSQRQKEINQEMMRLDDEVRPLLKKEEFKAAADLYERARPRRTDPEWAPLIDGRIQEVHRTARQLLETVQDKMIEVLRSGIAEEERQARERVSRWGLPELEGQLENFLSGPARRQMIAQGLIGWWKMDEGSGMTAKDSSTEGRPGLLGGGAAWTEGRRGKALSFDGRNAHVRIHPFFNSVRDTFSLALWAFPRAEMRITPEETAGTPVLSGHRFAVFPTHGKHFGAGHAGVGLSIGTNGIGVFEHADSHFPSLLVHPAPIQGWTHVALVVLDRVPTLFLNGERAKSGLRSTRVIHPSCMVGGGSENYGTYNGLLEDVRIYDRALTEEEIRLIAEANGRPWRRIFDGRTNECLRTHCRTGWIVDQGDLIRAGPSNAAQTVEEFEDGEIRVRFKVEGPETLTFSIRQGDEGKYFVKWDSTSPIRALEGQPHDLVFACRGESVTATLDGKPVMLRSDGNPRRGCLQFNGAGRVIRILAIEFRPLP